MTAEALTTRFDGFIGAVKCTKAFFRPRCCRDDGVRTIDIITDHRLVSANDRALDYDVELLIIKQN